MCVCVYVCVRVQAGASSRMELKNQTHMAPAETRAANEGSEVWRGKAGGDKKANDLLTISSPNLKKKKKKS